MKLLGADMSERKIIHESEKLSLKIDVQRIDSVGVMMFRQEIGTGNVGETSISFTVGMNGAIYIEYADGPTYAIGLKEMIHATIDDRIEFLKNKKGE